MKLDISRLRNRLLLSALLVLLNAALPLSVPAQQPANSRGIGVEIKGADGRSVRLYDKSYALVIGVSEYAHWPRLPGVKRDLVAVRQLLEGQGFAVTTVENPDSLQLDLAFKNFIQQYGLNPENRLLFYFAGHGHTIRQSYGDEMGYIVPADAPNPNVDRDGFTAKALDMQQMEYYARRIQAKHALFLFDSCFSGSFFALARAIPESISYKTSRPVRQFITSGSADEIVPDQSIFRQQFIAALEGEADVNRDGYVTGTELGEFLQDRIVNYSRNAQHPQYGKIRNPNLDKGDFVFALAKAPTPPAASNVSPAPQPVLPAPVGIDPAAIELAFWNAIKDSKNPEEYKAYLERYPNGQFASIARLRVGATESKSPPSAGTANNTPSYFPIRISVPAENIANGWKDSGLFVRRGQRLRITATGRVSLGHGTYSTPSGLPRITDNDKLMRDQPTGALIAVIGDDNDDFIFIGTSREFVAQRDGRLFLGVNDGNLNDNSGAYDVTVEAEAITGNK